MYEGLEPKCLLKADKDGGLEWILDQYKEKKPKDPTIREKFNTYRFADYKEKVVDLLMRVTTVSVHDQYYELNERRTALVDKWLDFYAPAFL